MPAKKRLARDQAYPSRVKAELWAILAPKNAHLNAKLQGPGELSFILFFSSSGLQAFIGLCWAIGCEYNSILETSQRSPTNKTTVIVHQAGSR